MHRRSGFSLIEVLVVVALLAVVAVGAEMLAPLSATRSMQAGSDSQQGMQRSNCGQSRKQFGRPQDVDRRLVPGEAKQALDCEHFSSRPSRREQLLVFRRNLQFDASFEGVLPLARRKIGKAHRNLEFRDFALHG